MRIVFKLAFALGGVRYWWRFCQKSQIRSTFARHCCLSRMALPYALCRRRMWTTTSADRHAKISSPHPVSHASQPTARVWILSGCQTVKFMLAYFVFEWMNVRLLFVLFYVVEWQSLRIGSNAIAYWRYYYQYRLAQPAAGCYISSCQWVMCVSRADGPIWCCSVILFYENRPSFLWSNRFFCFMQHPNVLSIHHRNVSILFDFLRFYE